VEVKERMIQDKRHLNFMDMGMGKSLVTLLAVIEQQAFPCMIVCTKSAMYVLEAELQKWFGMESIVYAGKPKKREELWKDFATRGVKFIICNYSMAAEVGTRFGLVDPKKVAGVGKRGTEVASIPHPGTKTKWNVGSLIADEIQLGGLFNEKNKSYKVFKYLCKQIPVVYLLTGTPYRRGVIDLYGPLSLVDPVRFKSYWAFVSRYCLTIDTGFGKSIERSPKDVVEFRKVIREYASILKKTDHLKDMPKKQRIPVPLVMDDEQARVYNELTEEMFTMTDSGELIMAPGILSLTVRQRQLLVAPQELGLNTKGAAIDYVLENTEDLVEGRDPFVIFTPFRKAVKWIGQALREKYSGLRIFTITGGLTPEEFSKQWKGFQEGTGARVLICVIKSGSSFHATCAANAFFLGYEYDFNQNTQAEDRLYRIGQTRPVSCYYVMFKGTVDEQVIQILNEKQYTSDLVLSDEKVFQIMMSKRMGT
jgi:SNF2 family DNA or RNA helicase